MSYRMQRKYRMNYWDRACLEILEATTEAFRINVDQVFHKLLTDPEMEEYSFPPTLNNFERKFIHEKCLSYNLISRSRGKEPDRYLTIYKRLNKSNFESFFIDLSPKSQYELNKLQILNQNIEYNRKKSTYLHCKEKMFGKLLMSTPSFVHATNVKPEIQRFQQHLPIYTMRSEIIDKIRNNRVIIVTSETGSGKTTQLPQYILDDARNRNETCRIICTQPRRISAVSVAERVAYERGTKLGEAVGYHIRLESRYGDKCNLIYCTNGVLIRTLLSGRQVYKTFTHIILDEVHERDKLSDFLLICLREILRKYNNFKVILMSATIDIEKFQNYFNQPEVICIPGRLFSITELFLNDVLKMLNYIDTIDDKNDLSTNKQQHKENLLYNQQFDEIITRCSNATDQHELDEIWSQIFVYLLNENMPVNYQHTETGATILMAAIIQENYDVIERLLHLGADPRLRMKHGCDCLQLAQKNEEILTMLTLKLSTLSPDEEILDNYYKKFNDEEINYDLLSKLIKLIHEQYHPGAILVFLPGYDDIMLCYEHILNVKLNPYTYRVYFLHGSMNIKEQHEVFQPSDNRKIILSTNIAETSVTIDDVVYVIDSGKAKVQNYDSCSGLSSLQTQWISKACVKQRAGRAGRTKSGICFHLFSKLRYQSLLENRIPEILRVPLEELCLNTKTLDMKFSSIYHFLSLALDPPSPQAVKNAIENLQCLGALDKNENLTPLGEYLSQLTIEPHLGKILVYSVIFKCLDPVLTIVACMAQKDPFQLPPQANLRSFAATKRRTLMLETGSDHMTYLNAFIKWQESILKRKERNFCRDFFISSSTMEMILKTRNQLNKQLRASQFIAHVDSSMIDCNQMSDNWALVKAVLTAGLYPKLAFKKNGVYCTRSEKKVIPHGANTLNRNNITLWLVYDDMINTRSVYHLRGVTPITPITIALMCGVKAVSNQPNHLTIDDWLELEFPDSTILHLRRYIDTIIEKKLLCSTNPLTKNELFILEIVSKVLQAEEEVIDMPLPREINQKPAFFELQRGYNNIGYNKIDLAFNPFAPNTIGQAAAAAAATAAASASNQPSTSSAEFVLLSGRLTDTIINRHQLSVSTTSQQRQQKQEIIDVCGEISVWTGPPSNGVDLDVGNSLSSKLQSVSINFDRYKSMFLLIHVDELDSIKLAYETSNFIPRPPTMAKIKELDKSGYEIYLFFTIYRLKLFYGIAQFVDFNNIDSRSLAILEWKNKKTLNYDLVSHLRNPSNHNVAIFDGNDGQVVDIDVALDLWKIYEQHGNEPEFE